MEFSEEDDDIPGLESVSSSEYVEDSEGESDGSDDIPPGIQVWVDPLKQNYQVAKKWLEQDPAVIDKHMEVIVIHLLSPFLYGHAHQTDRWLGWCQEAGLLISDVDYNTGCLSQVERNAIDVLDMAVVFCKTEGMQPEAPPDALAWLLELADDIRPVDCLKTAVKMAKRRGVFQQMLSSVTSSTPNRIGGSSRAQMMNENFIEAGCLYAINQTAEHVQEFIKSDHDLCADYDEQLMTHEKSGEMLRKKADELFNAGKSQDAIEIYSTAIVCGPYNYQLYTKRAYAHIELQEYQCALSDGLRAIYLRPDCSKGYVRYIQSLNVCGESERASEMKRIYHTKFPGSKEKEQLRIALDHLFGMEKRKIEPTEEDKVLKEKLLSLCKQASEAALRGNNDEALFYFSDALSVSAKNKGWQHCLVHSDCLWFQISLHFAYGLSLLKKGTGQCSRDAVDQFSTILDNFTSITFPPACWGMAMGLIQLHRHGDALHYIQRGLDKLSVYRLPCMMSWPGTDDVITECLAQNVKLKLLQLQVQCQPSTISDAVCRYGNCLQYYTSTAIQKDVSDYKGHVLMQCTQNCCISYHASCWRRFKSEGVISTEKDYLLTSCPTPDCHGTIRTISVYNTRGKVQHQFEAPSESLSGTKTNDTPTFKEGRRSSRSKQGRKKKSEERLFAVEAKAEVVKEEDSEIIDERHKAEDGLVINKQPTNREGDVLKSKIIRKKKSKQSDPTESSVAKQHWGELFTLPERKGLLSEATCAPTEDQQGEKGSFQPPPHLREAIQTFEQCEVPTIGLVPRPAVFPPKSVDFNTSDNLEFIFSYFAEIFRTHGPLLPADTRLTDSLTFLPEEKMRLIESSGGLKGFLLCSPLFMLKDDTICLVEGLPKNGHTSMDSANSAMDSGTGTNSVLDSGTGTNSAMDSGTGINSAMDSGTGTNSALDSNNDEAMLSIKPGVSLSGVTNIQELSGQCRSSLDDDVSMTINAKTIEQESQVFEKTRIAQVTSGSIAAADNIRVSVSVQTDVPLFTEKWVMTDPLPPVENFRESYEKVLKEKNDLHVKLERIEDEKYKMMRDHKREVEKLKKKYWNEAREEAAGRIKELEELMAEERSKGQSDKREQTEQLRSAKSEIKSLTEKIDKMKREGSKKEKHHASMVTQHQREIECLQSDKKRIEERLLTQSDCAKKEQNRAIVSEVELLGLRRDAVVRPGEQRLREVDNICASIPQGSEFHRDWMAYRDKLKTALDCFQNAMDDQVRQVKSGCELIALDKVPNPTVPLPPQLAAFRMPMLRPRFIPMMPVRGPLPPGSHIPDPSNFKGGVPPIVNGPIPPTMRVMQSALPQPVASNLSNMPQPVASNSSTMPQPVASNSSTMPQPVASNSVTNTTMSILNDSSGGATSLLDLDGGGSGKKSSFERIMEKLAPLYPNYARDDFKGVLREVRRNNNNTLSGLSLDSIASQVKGIIDAREKNKTRGKQGKGKPGHRLQVKRLPPVALAPPPLLSSTDYDDEGSCIICYEEMDDSDSSRLNCGHYFHTECIRSWFKEQSTCPTCRNHSLLPEEYPML